MPKSIWFKYKVVRLADKVGDKKTAIRYTNIKDYEVLSARKINRWRSELPKIHHPLTKKQYFFNMQFDEDFSSLPILNSVGISIQLIPEELKNAFFHYCNGRKIGRKIAQLVDYDLLNDDLSVSFLGKTVLAANQEDIFKRCSAAEITLETIYYDKFINGNEISAGNFLTKDGGNFLFIENDFPRIFLEYLTFSYQEISRFFRRIVENKEDIKNIDRKVIDGEVHSYKKASIISNVFVDYANNELTYDFFRHRVDSLMNENNLWYSGGTCSSIQAYNIYNLIGYEGCRRLLTTYVSNPCIMRKGWPDLFVYNDNGFNFVEVKVGENVSIHQVQTLRLLNMALPDSVRVVRAYRK
ncbi:hypothetical protein [Halomonas sp. BC1]|uniref:hypothetical protein n=1 Tax=Halomonas sp. BC1 TaxID=1670448 RepID=UPI00111B55EA|nr:hypothetical protein [Halomonas sp. BC1]